MFPSETEKLITSTIIGFLSGCVITALLSFYQKLNFDGMLSAFITLVAAFSGAWFAFYLERQSKQDAEIKKQIVVINHAIFTLMRQRNAAENMWRAFEKYLSVESLAFEMPALKINDYEKIRHDLDSLSFMASDRGVNILLELSIEEERFDQMLFAIRQKHQHHVEHVMPEMMALGLTDRPVSIVEIKNGIKNESFVGAIQASEQARDEIYHFRISSKAMHSKLRKYAVEKFPKGQFIEYKT